MATTKFDIKTEATKTFYAGAGVVDLGVEVVREAVSDAQKRIIGYQRDVNARVSDVQKSVTSFDFKTATAEAKARRTAVEKRVVELQDEAKAFPAKFQSLVSENVATATDTYEDLAKRGETLVGKIRGQESAKTAKAGAKQTVRGAKTTKTQATKAATATKTAAKRTVKTAAKKSATARSSAKGTATSAKKTASSTTKAVAEGATKVGS